MRAGWKAAWSADLRAARLVRLTVVLKVLRPGVWMVHCWSTSMGSTLAHQTVANWVVQRATHLVDDLVQRAAVRSGDRWAVRMVDQRGTPTEKKWAARRAGQLELLTALRWEAWTALLLDGHLVASKVQHWDQHYDARMAVQMVLSMAQCSVDRWAR